MAAVVLRYFGLLTGHSDGKGVRLQLLTEKGILREVPLTRGDLISIIKRAATALETIEREERKTNGRP